MANLTRSRGVYGLVGQLNHHVLNNQSCSSLGFHSKLPFLPNSSNSYPVSTHLRKAFAMPTCNSFLLRPKAADNGRFLLDQQFRSIANKGFTKQFKGTRIKGVCDKANPIAFGEYALQIIEPARITEKQIKAGRLALTRTARRGGKMWIRVHPNKPVTAKPTATRMGRGKGSLAYWAAVVKPGRILYEMSGVTEDIAKRAMEIAAAKLPMRTRFIKLG